MTDATRGISGRCVILNAATTQLAEGTGAVERTEPAYALKDSADRTATRVGREPGGKIVMQYAMAMWIAKSMEGVLATDAVSVRQDSRATITVHANLAFRASIAACLAVSNISAWAGDGAHRTGVPGGWTHDITPRRPTA